MRCIALAVLSYDTALAQNPIINSQFTADPTARVFNGKIYLYPSHDIPSPIEKLKEWFCMADYHVFSSTNLTEWQDHGVIVSQDKVPWVQDGSYTMWAPDCVEKDGKYYFYFPAAPKGEEKGFGIGVAVADQPEGPFMPMWNCLLRRQARLIRRLRFIPRMVPCSRVRKCRQRQRLRAAAGPRIWLPMRMIKK